MRFTLMIKNKPNYDKMKIFSLISWALGSWHN